MSKTRIEWCFILTMLLFFFQLHPLGGSKIFIPVLIFLWVAKGFVPNHQCFIIWPLRSVAICIDIKILEPCPNPNVLILATSYHQTENPILISLVCKDCALVEVCRKEKVHRMTGHSSSKIIIECNENVTSYKTQIYRFHLATQ